MLEYLSAFYGGLLSILPFTSQGQEAFFFMLVGIFIGFWVGILPGLGGAATLALMLPFIYKMDPTSAFAFLLGSNAVTATTGDITSILFGVPGEGVSAAVVVDGHPMAKKGEAGRALGAALMSSLVGAIFGAFALALALPLVRPLVLSIGSPEFFMLALLGLTFLAALSGGDMVKGFVAGGFGLALSMVGLDPIEGIPRFTFEGLVTDDFSTFLWDGISLVSVTVGLFAIPEIIDLAIQRTSIAREEKVGKLGGVMEGVKDTFRHWWLVIRCSAIGAYVGILPGIGGGTSQWVAYAHAVQSSANKERFGKGAVEGVLGPGAANNSTRGGDLVTTVAFGIPSSVSTAILLGAFIIQGIVPGPDLLNPAKYLTLTTSFVWIIIVSNIITVAVCFLFLNQLAKITFVRGTLLIPLLLLLVYLGGFTVKNSFGDMILVVIFGGLGWLMVQFEWPRPPLLLGLVLGTIAERNLWIATRAYHGSSWLLHPGVVIIGLIIIGTIIYSLLQKYRERRVQAGETAAGPMPVQDTIIQSPVYRPLFALFWLVLFGYVLRDAWFAIRLEDERAAIFPLMIGIPSLGLSALIFGREFLGTLRSALPSERHDLLERKVIRNRAMGILGWIGGFFVAIWLLGFNIAVPVATFLYLKFGAREKWPITVMLTMGFWIFFYGLFDYILHLPFPDGEAFRWLK